MTRHPLLTVLLLATCATATAQNPYRETGFDTGWLFSLDCGADTAAANPACDDTRWRQLDLPHDWAAEGDFSYYAPATAGGGALPGGTGWYRKHFTCPQNKDQRTFIHFDGIFMNSTVWLNGHKLGFRPYGYISFGYDLTPYIRPGADNVIAVRVDNQNQPNNRWYSGCGIYRHTHLRQTGQTHIAPFGIHAAAKPSTQNTKTDWTLNITATITHHGPATKRLYIYNKVADRQGRVIATQRKPLGQGSVGFSPRTSAAKDPLTSTERMTLKIHSPKLWSCDHPHTYTITTALISGTDTLDQRQTTTGFRTFHFSADKGFSLNGQHMKLNGVCLHHDLGCLGAAINDNALYRQLLSMKRMGANSIRTSHNPPAPELLEMCDTMGLIVMDEAFDQWHQPKTKYDYGTYFDQWAARDLQDFILRDRNHPSVLIWSIGNEVAEQWDVNWGQGPLSLDEANIILNASRTIAETDTTLSPNSLLCRNLAEAVRQLDHTRPVTAACQEPRATNHLFRSNALDIIGLNYHHDQMDKVRQDHPDKPFLFTESVSGLHSRGEYKMPSDSAILAPRDFRHPHYTDPTMTCSDYDNQYVPWGCTHEASLAAVDDHDYCAGQYVWTGWDYLGEPTPYFLPARSSYFGIVDLAGWPKDIYYLYQSHWTDKPVLHLLPHWHWLDGQTVDLWCYYSQADEVELFINGHSQGTRRKLTADTPTPDTPQLNTRYHVGWRVKYEPGEAKVVARRDGKVVAEQTVRTPGAPHAISLTQETHQLPGTRLTAFITAQITDSEGNPCPYAADEIFFTCTGGRIIGVDNGQQTSFERFKADHHHAYNGRCLVIVEKDDTTTPLTVEARAVGLRAAKLGELKIKN